MAYGTSLHRRVAQIPHDTVRFHLGAHLISAANDCRSILVLAIGQVFMRAIDSLEIIRQLSLSLSLPSSFCH